MTMTGLTLVSPPHSTSSLQSFSRNDTVFQCQSHRISFSHLTGNKVARKRWIVVWSKLSGYEEAMRIRKLREAQSRVKIKKRAPLRPGSISPPLPVPDHIPRPSYVGTTQSPVLSDMCQVHDSEGISEMRAVCQLVARALELAGTLVRPSVTTKEIDKAVHSMIIEAGAYPSQLGFCGFPKSISTSVNECVCHGIPDSRQLQNGDIITVDIAVFLNGYHGTASKTFICGQVNELVQRLVQVTDGCLERGISACKDGALYRRIGKRISEYAERYDFSLFERFVGHGIGSILHSEPLILHHRNDKPGRMVEGQTFTIGPTLTMGSSECVTWDDGWTIVTSDGSRAVKFEHTVLITKTGVEVLTKL
ncbi:Methionine aminopeptidase [Rhynchospora pubera]|uniref:Methionine aminopeptidase n=1 Tax=Rhynchospora pubera TaxID=906938 RepID=A0AAV8H926_9POAL|nr:Methionine aminopeptidase [Rhynchospora pubera]